MRIQKNTPGRRIRTHATIPVSPRYFRTGTLLVCALGIMMLTGCVSKQTYDQQLQQSKTLSTRVKDMNATIAALKDDLSTTRSKLADCSTELEQNSVEFEAEMQRQSAILHARKQKIEENIATLEDNITRLNEEKDSLRKRIEKQQAHIATMEQEKQQLALELEREQIARKARIAQMSSTYNELVGNLEQELERGELTIKQLKDKLSVNLVGQILFASGTANLTDDGKRVLRQVGGSLKKISNKRICVEGHTDNLTIKQSMRDIFPSNWELAAARAANVVHFLQDEIDIGGKRLEIRAMGPYQPVADNSTAEGRAQNRRIEIVLVDME